MRVACLLLLGFMPLFMYCQTTFPTDHREGHFYDTLEKYTYVIVSLEADSSHKGFKEVANSSGFFIRDANNRLFLVSAYHVFTGCPMYPGETPLHPERLKIWYPDNHNKYRSVLVPLTAYIDKPCKMAKDTADVDTMDVTTYFKDRKVFSIEHMVPLSQQKPQDIPERDAVVCYALFSDSTGKSLPKEGRRRQPLTGYTSFFITIPADSFDTPGKYYLTVRPAFKSGYSGAPVFRIRSDSLHTKAIEFAGIQVSNSKDTSEKRSHSLVVKPTGLLQRLTMHTPPY